MGRRTGSDPQPENQVELAVRTEGWWGWGGPGAPVALDVSGLASLLHY